MPYGLLKRDIEREPLPMAESYGTLAAPSQVAIAGTMARSRAVRPIIGPRTD